MFLKKYGIFTIILKKSASWFACCYCIPEQAKAETK